MILVLTLWGGLILSADPRSKLGQGIVARALVLI